MSPKVGKRRVDAVQHHPKPLPYSPQSSQDQEFVVLTGPSPELESPQLFQEGAAKAVEKVAAAARSAKVGRIVVRRLVVRWLENDKL